MPTQRSRRNWAGTDSRKGAVDNILNSASSMRDVVLRNKAIEKRLGHQKMHTDAIKCSSVLFDTTTTQPILADSTQLFDFTSLRGWTIEFSFSISEIPTSASRTILKGPFDVRITTGALLRVDVGVFANLDSATTIVIDTDYYASITYDPAGAGTLTMYLDGVSDAVDAAYGKPVNPSPTTDMEIGSIVAGAEVGELRVSELRMWDDLRTSGEVAGADGRQLTAEEIAADVELKHYWQFGEGGGDTADDLGVTDYDLPVCYDALVDGIIDGSNGALRIKNIEKTFASNDQNAGGDWSPWMNGDDVLWDFFVKFDSYPVTTDAWEYMFQPCGAATSSTDGMFMSLNSAGATTVVDLDLIFEHATEGVTISKAAFDPVLGQTYRLSARSSIVAAVRTTTLFIDGVAIVSSAGIPVVAVAGSTSSGIVSALVKTTSPTTVDGTIDYTVDDIRTWSDSTGAGVAKTDAFVAALGEHTLYDTDYSDIDFAANWKMESLFGRSGASLPSSPLATFSSTIWAIRPDAQFFGTGCALWSSGTVTCASPCIRGIHGYEGPVGGVNEALETGAGATYKINQTTNLLERLGPFSPQGTGAVAFTNYSGGGDRSYFADGGSLPWRYDGDNLYQAGIAPPPIAMILLSTTGVGAEWPIGDYKMGYTYIGKAPDGIEYESAMSPLMEHTLAGTVTELNLGFLNDSADPQVDSVQIYSTKADGQVLFKAQRFATPGGISGGLATITTTEADLLVQEEPNHQQPLNFKYMVERDGRMIWAGSPDAPRSVFFSEVDFPEYVGVLNFIDHRNEVTGLSVSANNELFIWGKTDRTVIFGDITNPFTTNRYFWDGGCLSHNSLAPVPGRGTFGVGPDGPFLATSQRYIPIDEFSGAGRITGSIRQLLEDSTDKTRWDEASSAYNEDFKTLYLSLPDKTGNFFEILPLQVDTSAWMRFETWPCAGVMTRRVKANGAIEVIGSAVQGFACELEASGQKDGLADGDASSFTVSSSDDTADTITLTATPTATGDGVKGTYVYEIDATNMTSTFIGVVTYQDGATLSLRLAAATLPTSGTVFIGVYRPYYFTKAMDMRTLSDNKKMLRWFETEHTKETTGLLKLLFLGPDDIDPTDFGPTVWASNSKQGTINLASSTDGRYGANISRERHVVGFGTIDPVPFFIQTWSLPEFEQMGVI